MAHERYPKTETITGMTPGTNSAAVTVATVSSNVAAPAGSTLVRIVSSVNCYIAFGTADTIAATADSLLFLAGTEYFRLPAGTTHIAFIRMTADGKALVTAMSPTA